MGSILTRFWTFSQNNSGGIFDHDPAKGIGYRVCVEAVDVPHAQGRMRQIVDSYNASYDCPCCGDRWNFYTWDEEGTDAPSQYGEEGEPLTGGWGIPSYIHRLDGGIEACADPKASAA